MWKKRSVYRILVGKPERKRALGRFRRRLENNIKMGLREIGWDNTDWIHLPQDMNECRAVVNTVMKPEVLLNVGKFLSG
jgi:hypothetical protein